MRLGSPKLHDPPQYAGTDEAVVASLSAKSGRRCIGACTLLLTRGDDEAQVHILDCHGLAWHIYCLQARDVLHLGHIPTNNPSGDLRGLVRSDQE